MIEAPCIDRRGLLAIGMAAALPLSAQADSRVKGLPVHSVLELFTSQGCSSCTLADAMLQSLKNEPGFLCLSLPVTIWDHLGWKDTLAQNLFTERQKHYASARGDRQIYTPQAVVDGVAHCAGVDRREIDAKRRDASSQPHVLSVTPTLLRDELGWTLTLPEAPQGRPVAAEIAKAGASERRSPLAGIILLVKFQREVSVTVARGENSGRTIRYGNVVRAIRPLGEYTGAALRLPLPSYATSDAMDGFAILVQSGAEKMPGAIIAAVESPRA